MTERLTLEGFKEKVAELDNATWAYKGSVPAIIDFYADWCQPCKMVAPILETLSAQYEGKLHIYKIDTDKEQELTRAFNITGIPSMLFIPIDGQPKLHVGAAPKNEIEKKIQEILKVAK
jgi:thioredoxin